MLGCCLALLLRAAAAVPESAVNWCGKRSDGGNIESGAFAASPPAPMVSRMSSMHA